MFYEIAAVSVEFFITNECILRSILYERLKE